MRIWLTAILVFLISSFGKSQRRFQDPETNKFGLKGADMGTILPAIYDEIQTNDYSIITVKKEGKMGTVDMKNTVVVPLEYDFLQRLTAPYVLKSNYFLVSKNSKATNTFGLLDAKGQTIVPQKFKTIQIVSDDLFAAKQERDTVFHFYNSKGKLVYKLTGTQIYSQYETPSVFSLGLPHEGGSITYQSNGQMVYPQDPLRGVWTNGEQFILYKDKNQKMMGVVDKSGREIIPFQYKLIRPTENNHFLVNQGYNQGPWVVFDKNGTAIIPETNYSVYSFGSMYIISDTETNLSGLKNAEGKELLPMNYIKSSINSPIMDWTKPNIQASDYIQFRADNKDAVLVKKDGTMVQIKGAASYHYFSEAYPLLVTLQAHPNTGAIKRAVVSLDGKTEWIPAEYDQIEFTEIPTLFCVKREFASSNTGGFINLLEKEPPLLHMEFPQRLVNGYFKAKRNGYYVLFDRTGQEVHEGEFNWLNYPDQEQLDTFEKTYKNTKGNLIAMGPRRGLAVRDRIGVTSTGEEVLFSGGNGLSVSTPPVIESDEVKASEYVEFIPPAAASEQNEHVYQQVELAEKATYKDGEPAMIQFIGNNLKYPPLAIENAIEGFVVVSFEVMEDGQVQHLKIDRALGGGCDQEALRIVGLMGDFMPGKKDGRPVKSKYILPIRFKLTK